MSSRGKHLLLSNRILKWTTSTLSWASSSASSKPPPFKTRQLWRFQIFSNRYRCLMKLILPPRIRSDRVTPRVSLLRSLPLPVCKICSQRLHLGTGLTNRSKFSKRMKTLTRSKIAKEMNMTISIISYRNWLREIKDRAKIVSSQNWNHYSKDPIVLVSPKIKDCNYCSRFYANNNKKSNCILTSNPSSRLMNYNPDSGHKVAKTKTKTRVKLTQVARTSSNMHSNT